MDGAVEVDGKIALVYFQPMPKLVKVGANSYFFDCQHGISLALVPKEVAQSLLDYLGGCCGGKRKVISLASPAVYKHWQSGDR